MKNLKKFSQFSLNEGIFDEIGLGQMKVFSKAMLDKFTISILPDVKKMMDGDFSDRSTWIEEYKNIFRKSCMQFGNSKKGDDVNKTCNKPQTLQKLLEHYLDPAKGLIDAKTMEKWVEETTKGESPSDVTYEYTPEDISEYVMEIIEVLKSTGISDADIKKSGTYALGILLPYMTKFYTVEDIENSEMIKSGKLMDAAKTKQLLGAGEASGGASGSISL
jgi:hypothetical protein